MTTAPTDETGTGLARVAYALCYAWTGICAATWLVLVAARALRYTAWSAAPGIDRLLGALMVLDTQSFLWLWGYAQVEWPTVAVAAAVATVALHRRLPAHLVARRDGRWRLTPPALALLLTVMVAAHYAFDVNPTVAAACATSLPIAAALRIRRTPRTIVLAVWTVFIAFWLWRAGDGIDRVAITVWMLGLWVSERGLAPRVGRRELGLARVLAIVPVNLLPALVPLVVPPSGATFVGAGLAYSFCEVPGRATVYAAIPVCGSVVADYAACRDGRIVEYDRTTKALVATHRFFSPDFYGRLELLECLPDEVQVGVQASVYRGRRLVQSAMAFAVDDPTRFTPVVAGPKIGNTFTYDAAHDALFYAGEFDDRLVRYDRRTGRVDDRVRPALARPWHEPVTFERFGNSLMLSPQGIDPKRNRLYVAECMGGSRALAFDLDTLEKVASYEVRSGAGIGVSVDAERNRLFVSSLWGLEVFDLTTDTLLVRKRLGLGNRPVVVDAPRNRLYVSSMVEGKIRILDRDTLAVIGQIPIGIGSRYPHLTRDGTTLFASSIAAHWAFDLAGR